MGLIQSSNQVIILMGEYLSQFIVFYNGTEEEPERQILELSDAFPAWSKKENAALECRAVVLNINLGYNASILDKCKKLKEYAQFIARVRLYLADGFGISIAIDRAIETSIEDRILEEILQNHREEVRSMLLTEYDEQAHIKSEREIALEKGREEGREEGENRLAKLVQMLLDIGHTDDLNRAMVDTNYRKQLFQEFNL